MKREALLEAAGERGIPDAAVAMEAADRRAAQRRFACFQHQEVIALLIAGRTTLGRSRGLSSKSWLALAGLVRELEVDVDARLDAANRRSAREDGRS